MLEIDEIVMKACAKHMRSICGDVLDKRSADNYQVNENSKKGQTELFVIV